MPLFGGDDNAALAEHLHSTLLLIEPFNSPADVHQLSSISKADASIYDDIPKRMIYHARCLTRNPEIRCHTIEARAAPLQMYISTFSRFKQAAERPASAARTELHLEKAA